MEIEIKTDSGQTVHLTKNELDMVKILQKELFYSGITAYKFKDDLIYRVLDSLYTKGVVYRKEFIGHTVFTLTHEWLTKEID